MLTMLRSFQTGTCRRILGIEISGPLAKAPIRGLPVRRLLAGADFPCRHHHAIPMAITGDLASAAFPCSHQDEIPNMRDLAESSLFAKSIVCKLKEVESVAGLSWKLPGAAINGKIVKSGVEFDSVIRASLVHMYVKFDLFSFGWQLFDEIKNGRSSLRLWCSVILECYKSGMLDKAVGLFEEMPEKNIWYWNSLIYGFMGNGEVDKALELFKRMGQKHVNTLTAMVDGFNRHGMHEKALETFFIMVEEGVSLIAQLWYWYFVVVRY